MIFVRNAMLLLLIALIVGQASPGWCGDIYKYVDEQGNVHFSDTPPPRGKKLKKIYKDEQAVEDASDEEPGHPSEKDRIVIPFMGRSGGISSRRTMVVDVTLGRGSRRITRRFVVDTGATRTVITQADARALGIKEEDVIDSGLGTVAGGGRIMAHLVRLSRLKVGDIVVISPSVVVLKRGDRLLGMDILGRYNIQVDHDNKLLILNKR